MDVNSFRWTPQPPLRSQRQDRLGAEGTVAASSPRSRKQCFQGLLDTSRWNLGIPREGGVQVVAEVFVHGEEAWVEPHYLGLHLHADSRHSFTAFARRHSSLSHCICTQTAVTLKWVLSAPWQS
eukprot:1849669-Rhodomonas_salina.2